MAAAEERRLNTTGDSPIEAILFGNYAITYRIKEASLLDQLRSVHYENCKDFSETYAKIQKQGKLNDKQMKLLSKLKINSSSIELG
eukprot:SAG31_NODE_35369_length_323_cov_48.196429_1_plen_86_part_00